MSEPRDYADKLRGAMSEIISGNSALNMHPDPIPSDELDKDINGYLSETDRMAQHAMEHYRKAFELLSEYEAKMQGEYLTTQEWNSVLAVIEGLFDAVKDLPILRKSYIDQLPEKIRKELEL